MKCNLQIGSWFGGENTSVKGTLELDDRTFELDCTGSASARGTEAKVNGEQKWWCGVDHPKSDGPPDVEQAVEDLYESAWNQVDEMGYEVEDGWMATLVDGKVTEVIPEEDEDE